MSTKFTPWHVDSKFLKERGCHEVLDSRNATIADVFGIDNARLFAAAPHMRAALVWAHNELTKNGFFCDGQCEICRAMNKADGQEMIPCP